MTQVFPYSKWSGTKTAEQVLEKTVIFQPFSQTTSRTRAFNIALTITASGDTRLLTSEAVSATPEKILMPIQANTTHQPTNLKK